MAKVPNEPIYLNNLGVALMNQGSDEEAMEYFSRAGRLDVRSDQYRKNTAAAAHRHVGGLLAPHWVRTVLLRHRYRGLSPAARTAWRSTARARAGDPRGARAAAEGMADPGDHRRVRHRGRGDER